MGRRAHPGLAEVFAAVYTLLVIYASLYPFTGWRDTGAPVTAYLTAAWPRYWTVFDLVTNILAYLPLGFLLTAALRTSFNRWLAALLALLFGFGLSLALESVQNFLPSRVASNVDLATNTLGVLIGAAAGLRWGAELLDGGRIAALRVHLVAPGRVGEYGLLLFGLWLLAQLNPEILLFGVGDLRRLLGLPPALPFSAERFSVLEGLVAGAATLGVGLFAALLLRVPHLTLLAGVLATTLAVRMLAAAILVAPGEFSHWATPGNSLGVAAGSALVALAALLPRSLQRALASLALMFATALVNLAPENPYLANTLSTWQQGHFLNFNGLTRLASWLWPYLALPWLMLADRPSRRRW